MYLTLFRYFISQKSFCESGANAVIIVASLVSIYKLPEYSSLKTMLTLSDMIIIKFVHFIFYLYLLNYENMITHLQETWKKQNKVTHSSMMYYNCFNQINQDFSWSFNIKPSEINRTNVQRSRRI